MKRRRGDAAESQDGRLISRGPAAPRLCTGEPRTCGVFQIPVASLEQLATVAENLRSRGMARSEDGVLVAGQFDLILCKQQLSALYVPPPVDLRGLPELPELL